MYLCKKIQLTMNADCKKMLIFALVTETPSQT